MSWARRRELPLLLTAILGIMAFADYFFAIPILHSAVSDLQIWTMIMAAFAMFMGVVNLTIVHGRVVMREKDSTRRILSAWTLFLMYLMAILGLLPPITVHPSFQWLYSTTVAALDPTVYSILAFFITSASYRAFRARNFEATVFLISGIIIMLYNAPIGGWLHPGLVTLGSWAMNVPIVAGQRAIMIGAAIGSLALAIRTFTGRESAWLRAGDGG
ncbi:MAG: hypothetical protein NDF54_01830 [archaeon GB-1867-035]|nr:hypothetical protein [Candidatus Culexmicrobium profundum]